MASSKVGLPVGANRIVTLRVETTRRWNKVKERNDKSGIANRSTRGGRIHREGK